MKYLLLSFLVAGFILPSSTLAAVPVVVKKVAPVIQVHQEVSLVATVTNVRGAVITVKSEEGKTFTLGFAAKASIVGPTGKLITKKNFKLGDRLRASGTVKGSVFTVLRLRNLGKESVKASAPTVGATDPTVNQPTVTGFTMKQVNAHAEASSCWTVIGNNVYDLTNWISRHPGGRGAILGICGKDGTAAFQGQHGGSAQAKTTLETFRIGGLQR